MQHLGKRLIASFLPASLAGAVVAMISFLYEVTISSILMMASVGASALILTYNHSPELTKLRITISSYLLAVVISVMIYFIHQSVKIDIALYLFLTIFLVGSAMIFFDVFHPPALTAALSFMLFERPIIELIYLMIAVMLVLIALRFATYTLVLQYPARRFFRECRLQLQVHHYNPFHLDIWWHRKH